MAANLSSSSREKAKRKSYTREFKLEVVKFYKENLYRTSKTYSLNTKTVLRWIKDEKMIKKGKKGGKHVQHQRRAAHPEMEEKLYNEFKELRKKGNLGSVSYAIADLSFEMLGLKVKGYWFRVRGRQILADMNPEADFSFCNGWFDRFKARHKISLRRSTNVAQKPASDKRGAIQSFHRNIRQVSSVYVPVY